MALGKGDFAKEGYGDTESPVPGEVIGIGESLDYVLALGWLL